MQNQSSISKPARGKHRQDGPDKLDVLTLGVNLANGHTRHDGTQRTQAVAS